MPTIPQDGLRSVATAPAQTPYQNIDAPEGAFGIGAKPWQDLGKAVSAVGDLAAAHLDKLQKQAQETAAADADNQVTAAFNDIGNRYLSLEGKNAYDGFAAAKQAAEAKKNEILGRIGDPETAQLAGNAAAARLNNLVSQMQRHQLDQFKIYQDDVSDARKAQAAENIRTFYNDPKQFDLNFHVIQSEIIDQYMRKGDPDGITMALAQVKSQLARTVIEAKAQQDPEGAERLLLAAAPTPPTGSDANGQGPAQAQQAAEPQQAGQATPNTAPNYGAMLTPEDRAAVSQFVASRKRQVAANARADLDQRYQDQRQAARNGQPITQPLTKDDFAKGYDSDAADRKLQQLQDDKKLGQAVKSYSYMTNGELQAIARGPAPVAGTTTNPAAGPSAATDDALAARDHTITVQAAAQVLQARAQDPAGYVLAIAPDVANDMANPQTRDQAINRSLNLQRQLGIPPEQRHALSQQQAADMVAFIRGKQTPQAQLDALIVAVGQGDEDQRGKIAGDLMAVHSGLPSVTPQILAQAALPETQLTARQLWSEVMTPNASAVLKPEDAEEIDRVSKWGLGDLYQKQARLTGNPVYDKALQGYEADFTQIAKARGARYYDYKLVAEQVSEDLSAHLALKFDPDLAVVSYPKSYDAQNPHAMEAGFNALRRMDTAAIQSWLDQAKQGAGGQLLAQLKPADLAADVAQHGVWVNDGKGFALYMRDPFQPDPDPLRPGQILERPKLGPLKFATYNEVFAAGDRVLSTGPKPWPFRAPPPPQRVP